MPLWCGQAMESMQPMRPAANHHQLAHPWSERGDKAREGVEVVHSALFPDDAVEYPLPDQVGLLASSRRVCRNIDPYLQDIAGRHASRPDHATKQGLWCRSLPHDNVAGFS